MKKRGISRAAIDSMAITLPSNLGYIDRSRDHSGARQAYLENQRDSDLVEQIRTGNTIALLQLYDAHHREAFRHAFNVVSDLECAERAVRNAFLDVWSERGFVVLRNGSVKAWLFAKVNAYASRELLDIDLNRSD